MFRRYLSFLKVARDEFSENVLPEENFRRFMEWVRGLLRRNFLSNLLNIRWGFLMKSRKNTIATQIKQIYHNLLSKYFLSTRKNLC